MNEPLDSADAKKLILQILLNGTVRFAGHALEEMANDALTEGQIKGVLRSGLVQFPEFEKGSWRYRVQTQRICAVIAFRSADTLVVVTAWRKK